MRTALATTGMNVRKEIRQLLDATLVRQQKLQGQHKLAQAHGLAGWHRDLWVLPLCPPANSLYPGKARRYKSKAYEEWLSLAESYWLYQVVQKRDAANEYGWPPPQASYPRGVRPQKWALDVYHFMPSRRDGDLDNRMKALIDFLAHATGHDDRYLDRIYSERITNGQRLRGTVVIFGGVE